MLTSIVIGNRFTQRKRGYIFTPRGYNDWQEESMQAPEATLPTQAIWVFAGTSDGNALAAQLAAQLKPQGYPVVVSTATEYGATLAAQDCPGVTVWAGRQGVEARKQALQKHAARLLVDATHPFATQMSEQLMGLSASLSIPYLRYERPSTVTAGTHLCDDMAAAAQAAIARGKRIFLATGSKDLASFLQAPGAAECEWFVRVTAEPEFLQRALDLGVPRSQLCAMQGPFSSGFNRALWQDWQIDCVVTKDSGDAGGYQAKLDAATELGIPLLTVRRPALDYPVQANSIVDACAQAAALLAGAPAV